MKKLNHLTVQYIQLLQQINSLHAQKKILEQAIRQEYDKILERTRDGKTINEMEEW